MQGPRRTSGGNSSSGLVGAPLVARGSGRSRLHRLSELEWPESAGLATRFLVGATFLNERGDFSPAANVLRHAMVAIIARRGPTPMWLGRFEVRSPQGTDRVGPADFPRPLDADGFYRITGTSCRLLLDGA